MKRLRLPGPGPVVAVIALVAALGGTRYATTVKTKSKTVVPKQSVGSAQIKDHSLLLEDFRPGQIPDGKKGGPPRSAPPPEGCRPSSRTAWRPT